MKNSNIEWTDHTFNPWIGCTEISDACTNCYARVLSARTFKVKWGAGEARQRTSPEYWKHPLSWDAEAAKTGVRKRVFCASLADVFDKEAPDEWRADLFDLIRKTPNLTWMILTKRIGNWRSLLTKAHQFVMKQLGGKSFNDFVHEDYLIWDLGLWLQNWLAGKPPQNVHLGITVCNQPELDRDYPKLVITPADKRFLSLEPMLGPIEILWPFYGESEERLIDLVILGGESGPRARPLHPNHSRSMRDRCAEASIPFMKKQWGEWLPALKIGNDFEFCDQNTEPHSDWLGKPMHDFGDGYVAFKVGKKKAGRLLDGVEHNGVIS